ncbi:hypothetical protein [Streptomyces cavernae]|uniref:hypothetical protein n=1 Tax=Streptomyces cavernae TaxID=2259034 RepID=UPI000FEC081F|nr:hypothetical protein [Streptomyces cavernae]
MLQQFRHGTIIFTLLGGYVGTVTGISDIGFLGDSKPVLILVATALVTIAIVLEIQNFKDGKPFYMGLEEDSHKAMEKLLRKNGKAVIFTVDLSFARDNQSTMDALLRKAELGELTLCVPRLVREADLASQRGADVHVYADASWTPKSRFTMIRYNQDDSEVYFGHYISTTVFVIECFRHGSVPHVLAEDLARLTSQRFPSINDPRNRA